MVAIDGGKNKGATHVEYPTLLMDNEEIELESFVLSGMTTDGKRCVLTANCSVDELGAYSMILHTIIQEKIKDSLI